MIAVLITDADQKKTRKAKDPYGAGCSPSYLLVPVGTDAIRSGTSTQYHGNADLVVTGDVVMEDLKSFRVTTLQKAELSVSTDIRNASSS